MMEFHQEFIIVKCNKISYNNQILLDYCSMAIGETRFVAVAGRVANGMSDAGPMLQANLSR